MRMLELLVQHIAHLDFHLAAYPHLHQRAIALVGLVLADDQPSPPQTRAQNPSARHLDALDAYRSAPQLLGIVNAMTDRPGAITAPARRPHATDGAVAHFDSIDTDLDRLGMINAVRQLDTCDRLVKGQLWPQVAALHRPDASDALGRLLAVILPLVKFSEDAGDDPADKVEQCASPSLASCSSHLTLQRSAEAPAGRARCSPRPRPRHIRPAPGSRTPIGARAARGRKQSPSRLLSRTSATPPPCPSLTFAGQTSANPAKPQQKRSVATAPALLSHAKIRQASEVAKYIDRDADWLAQRYADFHGSHLRLSFRPNGLPYDLSRLAHYLSGPIASDLPPTLATHLAASAFNLMAAVMPPLLQAAVLHRLFPDACNVACDAATEAPDREWSDGRERFVPHPLMAYVCLCFIGLLLAERSCSVRLYAEACGYRIADLLGTAASVKKSMMCGMPLAITDRLD
jgi:hypothetical protein